jgi:hypothetical protein
MRKSMTAAALTAVVVLAAATGAGAATVPSPSYTVAGLATFTPQGSALSFTGLATGSTGDRGIWRASITSGPLAGCSSLDSSCTITGGTFGLNSSNSSQFTGTITGGTVAPTAQAAGCGRLQFTVDGTAVMSTGDVVTFDVVMTQFRLGLRGVCLVLPGATVTGSVTIGPVMGG